MDLTTLALAKSYTDKQIEKAEMGDIELDSSLTKAGFAADAAAVGKAIKNVDLSGLATEEYVNNAIANIDFPETDLTGYATEEFVNKAIEDLSNSEDKTDSCFKQLFTKEEIKSNTVKQTIGESPLNEGEFYRYGVVSSNPGVSQTQFFDLTNVAQIILTSPANAPYENYFLTYKNNNGDIVDGGLVSIPAGETLIITPTGDKAAFSTAYYILGPVEISFEYIAIKQIVPQTLGIISDSIGTFQGYIPADYATFYPMGEIETVEQTWWNQLLAKTGMELCVNCSWSGSTVTGDTDSTTYAKSAASDKRVADLTNENGETPDNIIVSISINDFAKTNEITTGENVGSNAITQSGNITVISDAYVLLIKKLMMAYPKAKIYCCTILSENCNSESAGTANSHANGYPNINPDDNVTLPIWNDMIRKIANNMGCGLIDFATCGINFYNISSYTIDGLHPNIIGHKLMCQQALKAMINN